MMTWPAQRISWVLLCMGFGFWLHILTTSLYPTLLPQPPRRSLCAHTDLSLQERSVEENILKEAWSVYKANLQRRAKSFGSNGRRLDTMRLPAAKQRKVFHDSAFVLEYFRPIYPCRSEDRFSSWAQKSRYICGSSSLSPKSVVYSFGSEPHNTFEVGLFIKRQPEIHLFDATLPAHSQLKLQRLEELHFHSVGVGVGDGGGVATLKTLMAKYDHSYVDVLKLACDGCEYQVLPEILKEAEVPIGQIIVDVHKISQTPALRTLLTLLEARGFLMFHRDLNFRDTECMTLAYIHEAIVKPKLFQQVAERDKDFDVDSD